MTVFSYGFLANVVG